MRSKILSRKNTKPKKIKKANTIFILGVLAAEK
jgi:hypothetical protein